MRLHQKKAIQAGQTRQTRRDATPGQIATIKRLALRVTKLRGKSKHENALVLADAMEEANWPSTPNRIPTGRKGPRATFDMQSLDVWGNAKDGWEVNNWFNVGTIRVPTRETLLNVKAYAQAYAKGERQEGGKPLINILRAYFDTDNEDIYRVLKVRYLADQVKRRHIYFDHDGSGSIEVQLAKNGKPLLLLQLRSREDED